jgi:predicted dehydrogenase
VIRVGIIGSSGIGRLHVDALRRIGVTVAVVAAATPEIAQHDADELGVARACASVEELTDGNVEVVHVCTPNALHLSHCQAAISAGKHVICEKPLATSINDAEELLRLAEGAGLVHALCHSYRYYPMLQALRALIASGELGRVHTLHGSWLLEELLAIDHGHWMFEPRLMGPSLALADVGVHWWDLVEHVSGLRIREVLCTTQAVRPYAREGGGEDSAAIIMRLDGDTIASGTICQAAPGHGNTVTLEAIGDRAAAAWDIRAADRLVIRRLGGRQGVLERGTAEVAALGVGTYLPAGQPEGHADALRELFARIYAHIRTGEPTAHPTFVDGVRGLRVLEALLESARRGSWTAVHA